MDSNLLLSESYNQFTWDLYTKVGYGTNDNLFMSAFSILTALSMCLLGSSGDTLLQLKHITRLRNVADSDIYTSNLNLLNYINSLNEHVAFSIANKLFPRQDFTIKQNFIDLLKQYYNADIQPLDFSRKSEACQIINDWVLLQTNGKIHDLIQPDSLNEATKMILVNAIYFKGDWLYKFNANETTKDLFFLRNEGTKEIDMMQLLDKEFRCQNSPFEISAHVCELPYVGGSVSMSIILPINGVDLKQVETQLTSVILNQLIKRQRSKSNVRIFLPKFRMETSFELSKVLQQLGAIDAFNAGKADFSGISDEGLLLSNVIHKAYVEVNEEGSEAAAATAITGSRFNAVELIDDFRCNRPFIFLIHDGSTIFFIGKYAKP